MDPREHILIVGAGFGGLCAAIRLKQAGIETFTVLEKGDRVGGTWRDNHYPGAACDVPSHLYSFSFAPKTDWSRKYAPQAEILAYLEGVADRFGVRPHLRFGVEVLEARFDEGAGLWRVRTASGETLSARVVISAVGALTRPALPDIPGVETFAGPVLHSARWQDDAPLEGKTVAVIGTGASAIQVVPRIAPKVGQLHLFQRTPAWIMPRRDRAHSGAEQWAFEHVPGARWLYRQRLYWQHEVRAFGFVRDPRLLRAASALARRHLEAQVADPALRAKLTPSYQMGCKRILIADDYYPAVARPNVELVTDPIARIDEAGIVTADGQRRPVDALVLCTGFHAAEDMAPFPVVGRSGQDLREAWRDGGDAYLGTVVSGYPNLFLVIGPNTGLGHNSMVFIIESQLNYILGMIEHLRERRLKLVDVRADVQERFNQRLQERMGRTIWNTGGCQSWYLTRDGRNTTLWPGFTFEFALRTRRADPTVFEQVGEGDRG